LNLEAGLLSQTGHRTSPQVLSEHLDRPNFSSQQDLFIAETAGEIVGYLEVTPELNIGRIILNCLVHPKHRRRGLATRLFFGAMHRASELGASVAQVNILQDNLITAKLLSKLGFQPVRRFLELRLELADIDLPDVDFGASSCRRLKHGEEDKLTQIQNRSFIDTWGYNPNTVEEIAYRINLTNCSPEDAALVYENEKPIGYCWTKMELAAGTTASEGKGRIYMLGVDPSYRGRGIGRKALLTGLRYLKNRNLKIAELTVDSENTVACALYRALGFGIRTISLWYEKPLH